MLTVYLTGAVCKTKVIFGKVVSLPTCFRVMQISCPDLTQPNNTNL